MKNSFFTHLHLHTEYSLLDGCGTAKGYCERAKELGFKSIAITDHGNVDGAIRFQGAAEDCGLIPVIGCEAYIVPDAQVKRKGESRGHVILMIKNEEGFRNVLNMMSYANLTGHYNRPRIDFKTLLSHCEGLVVSTACIASFILLEGGMNFLESLYDKIGSDLYLEVMPHAMDRQKDLNRLCLDLRNKLGLSLLATNDCHYVNPLDWEAQKTLLGIQYDLTWDDAKLEGYVLKGIHLRTADEMEEAFDAQRVLSYRDYVGAMRATSEVVDKCGDFRIDKKDVYLPVVPGYEGQDDFETIKNKCFGSSRFVDDDAYVERLNHELGVIGAKENFPRYFLLVYDMIEWCLDNDIPVGPGRGSAAGSLISYLLKITSIDPIKHGLLFSRFIAEDRIDFPDIDIDFDSQKIDLIRDRMEKVYGEGCVASIGTFSRLKNRGVIRDVGKVFDVPFKDVDPFAKSLDSDDDLSVVFTETVEGREFARKYPKAAEMAVALKGIIKNRGRHAAAIVISPEDLRNGSRASLVEKEGLLTVNWEKEDAEYMGLLKIDALSLNTIAVMAEANRLIGRNYGDKIDFDTIPLEDPEVIRQIGDGHTVGLFQINTKPTTQLLMEVGISSFQHICDTIALVRPGPMDSGQTAEYVKRKHGAKWTPAHPLYEEVTKDTYGVVCYQEQVMKVINLVAGLDYSVADKIRKVIGKKRDVAEFKPFHDMFVEGCLNKKTMSKNQAEEFWSMLEKHANYSFNLSHSVAYSIIAVQMGWLKHYYPTEFICGALTFGSSGDRLKLIKEAKRLGLRLVPPKVGISDAVKWMARDGNLYIPFIEVKNIGPVMAREAAGLGSPFGGKRKGFFSPSKSTVPTGKLGKILLSIKAYDRDEVPDNIEEYLDGIDIGGMEGKYPNLEALVGNADLGDAVDGRIVLKNQARKVSVSAPRGMKSCSDCLFRDRARQVVIPSPGKYNIMVLGEGPGREEDKEGQGFVGESGDLLWNTLKIYKIYREMLYVSNVEHCFPGREKNDAELKQCIDICARKWLDKEIKALEPRIVLVMGNWARYALTGQSSGIQSVSGETLWLEDHGFWACWSVHPASVLRSPGVNKPLFEKGIRNFSDAVEKIGGI